MPLLRFAPSPNGALHLGHAYSALVNAAMATELGGALLLRIEDIDQSRCTPELAAGLMADLDWLGITFDGPVRWQSAHFADYAAALERLRGEGLLYQSFETRAELKAASLPEDPDGAPRLLGPLLSPDEQARRRENGAPYAWRLAMQEAARRGGPLCWRECDKTGAIADTVAADPLAWGDVILARKETPTSYHLSVVVDDALQGITHVVRGRDLFAATAVHRLLQRLLGLPEPLYRHHRLIVDEEGRKLSKSRASTALCALRAAGNTPQDIRRMVGLAEV